MSQGQAAYKGEINRGGTPVAFSDQAVIKGINNPAGTTGIYQISAATRQVIDISADFMIEEQDDGGNWHTVYTLRNGCPQADNVIDYKVDTLFGGLQRNGITLNAPAQSPDNEDWLTDPNANQVRVQGNYVPLVRIGGGYNFSVNLSNDLVDSTVFESGGYRERTPTLFDANVSFERYYVDPASGTTQSDLKSFADNRTPILFEGRPGGNSTNFSIRSSALIDVIRGWFNIESTDFTNDVAALVVEQLNLQLRGEFRWIKS